MKNTQTLNSFSQDRIFYLMIVLSFVAHALTIVYWSITKFKSPKKTANAIEVTYEESRAKEIIPIDPKFKEFKIDSKRVEPPPLPKSVKIIAEKPPGYPSFDGSFQEASKMVDTLKVDQKFSPDLDSLGHGEKVVIPMFKSEKITNPKYIGYQDSIRQRIHQIILRYVKNQEVPRSKVYVSFILLSNGELRDVRVVESKSNAPDFLKDISVKSIREGAPYAPFPEGLDMYPELPYNIQIEYLSD